jgi:CRP-like cAMP-binding protein
MQSFVEGQVPPRLTPGAQSRQLLDRSLQRVAVDKSKQNSFRKMRSEVVGQALQKYRGSNHTNTTFLRGENEDTGYISKAKEGGEEEDPNSLVRVHVPDGSAYYFGGNRSSVSKNSSLVMTPKHSLRKPINKQTIHPEEASNSGSTGLQKFRSAAKVVGTIKTMGYRLNDTIQEKIWFVLNPRNVFFDYWATAVMLTMLWVAVLDPFRVSFLWEDGWLGKAAEWCVNLVFVVDLALGFFSAYEVNVGMILELVTEPRLIVRHYLCDRFFVDLLSSLPLVMPLFYTNNFQKHYNVFRLPKLVFRLPALIESKMSTWSQSNQCLRYLLGDITMNTRDGMARIAKICMAVLMLTHWVACFWHAIPTSDGVRCAAHDGDQDWIVLADLCDASTTQMYVTSIYWAFTTLSTVGFGDIVPRTNGEKLFCMLVMLLGVSCYAYILGSVSIVISHFDVSERHEHQRHRQLAKFCNDFNVPMEIRRRLTHNLDFKLNQKQESRDYNIEAVLSDFSPSLRVELISVIHAPLIQKLPYLHGKSREFVARVISVLQTLVAYSGDMVTQEGKIASAMYFVGSGRLQVILQEVAAGILVGGQSFGEVGCLLGVVTASVQAVETCELYPMHRESVLSLMAEFPAFELEMKEKALVHVSRVEEEDRLATPEAAQLRRLPAVKTKVSTPVGGVAAATGVTTGKPVAEGAGGSGGSAAAAAAEGGAGGGAGAEGGAGGAAAAAARSGKTVSIEWELQPLSRSPTMTGPPIAGFRPARRVQDAGKPVVPSSVDRAVAAPQPQAVAPLHGGSSTQVELLRTLRTFMTETREHQQAMETKLDKLVERVDVLSARSAPTSPPSASVVHNFTT